ncbi:MAG: Flp pilus assembly complex ATPase component TadA [Actinobacteria bacterium]|nr:Flp pilus assembly complex ATPase component TadA [Actinomycetota bacterium]
MYFFCLLYSEYLIPCSLLRGSSFTGSTSQGKTTTLSAIINEINLKFKKHIITIEDPIEYVHKNINCVVRQREVGR